MSKMRWRYVEVTDGEKFRAVVLEAESPNAAEEDAREQAARAWGVDPEGITEFAQRTLTPEKAQKLTAAMENGTFDPDWWING